MSIQLTAVLKAVKMLEAAGAKFHVVLDDHVFGAPVRISKSGRVHTHRRGELRDLYVDRLRELQPGHSLRFVCPENYTVEAVRASMCSWASLNWGNGSYISEISHDPEVVEILRVE